MLDRVRACSTTPDDAVDFFTRMLHPVPDQRLTTNQALEHSYLLPCVRQMQRETAVGDCECEFACTCHVVSAPVRASDSELRLAERGDRSHSLVGLPIRAGMQGFRLVKGVITGTAKIIALPITSRIQHILVKPIPDLDQLFPSYQDPQMELSAPLSDGPVIKKQSIAGTAVGAQDNSLRAANRHSLHDSTTSAFWMHSMLLANVSMKAADFSAALPSKQAAVHSSFATQALPTANSTDQSAAEPADAPTATLSSAKAGAGSTNVAVATDSSTRPVNTSSRELLKQECNSAIEPSSCFGAAEDTHSTPATELGAADR